MKTAIFALTHKGAMAALEPGEILCPEDFPPEDAAHDIGNPISELVTVSDGIQSRTGRLVSATIIEALDTDGDGVADDHEAVTLQSETGLQAMTPVINRGMHE